MILQALLQLAENEQLIADPDFEFKPVAWIVRLKSDGQLIAVEDNREDLNTGQTDRKGKPIKPKWVGRRTLVPIQFVRTSGDAAYFAVDKAEYVLGVDPAGGRGMSKVNERLKLFYKAIEACANSTRDPSAKAVAAFGQILADQGIELRTSRLPKELVAGDLIMFRVGRDAEPMHGQPSIRTYWKAQRIPPEANGDSSNETESRRCLITGNFVEAVPLFRKVKNMPGDASGGLSLVSFNASAWESYGWKGEDNAPVSREAAEAAVTALSRLLDPRPTNGQGQPLPVRRIRLADDTAVVFWSPEPEAQQVLDAMPAIFDPPDTRDQLGDVGNLLVSVQSGVFKELRRPAAFYAMTLTSMTGRIVVRDWLESTVTRVQAALRNHFDVVNCVRNTPPARGLPPRPAMTLRELLDSLAAPGREKKIPTALGSDFVTAALTQQPYPRSILQRALLRERAEATAEQWENHIRRDARAALIKAVLMRDPTYRTKLEASMDDDRPDPGYLLGRLMAVLEDTQRLASRGVNASVKDKFYGAASATPAAVFPTMMDLFHKHARKARDSRPGAVVNREKLADSILAKLTQIPVHLDLKQQGLFVLGYHHQRHELYKKASTDNGDAATTLEGATA